METATFWTDALRRKLHPRRSSGVRTRPRKPAEAFARMREAWQSRAGIWAESTQWKDPGTRSLFAAARDKLSGDAEGVPPPGSPEEEAAVLAILSIQAGWAPPIGGEVVDFWFGTAGPAFAVEALATSLEIHAERGSLSDIWLRRSPAPPAGAQSRGLAHGFLGLWLRLRRLLASAGEAEWERARETAERLRSGSDHLVLRAGLAYLFPDVPEWAEEDARDTLGTGQALAHAGCLLTCVRDGDLLERLMGLYRHPYTMVPRLDTVQDEPDVAGVALSMAEGAGPAAAPALEKLLILCPNAPQRRACAEALALLPDARAVAALTRRSDLKEVIPSATEAAQRFPRLALPALASEVARGGKTGKACDPVLRQLVLQNPGLGRELLPVLPEAARRILEPLLGRVGLAVVEAPPEALPPILVQPPWTETTSRGTAVRELRLDFLSLPDTMAWREGQREEWLVAPVQDGDALAAAVGNSIARELRRVMDDEAALREKVRGFAPQLREWHYNSPGPLARLPGPVALILWDEIPSETWAPRDWDRLERFLAMHEMAALPGLLRFAGIKPAQGLPLLQPFRAQRIAPVAARALSGKQGRPAALRWLRLHAEHAAAALIPPAVGPAGEERDAASAALQLLAGQGRRETVLEVAARYGEEALGAVREVLDGEPLARFPRKLPQMPGFWQPEGLTRPRLRDSGAAFSLAAAGHLGTMLAFSRLDEPYAGLRLVREACDPSSLAAFAWDLFQSWLVAGAPAEEAWAFHALGHLGDDACARRLAPLIRQWPAEGGHTRAVIGLDVLRAIGTDVALMLLHGIAEKARHQGIQKAAAERIQDLADQRGLTAEELADRLVPDLGLGPDGSLVLDFGPRSFRVGFDEHLRPFIRDAEGRRLADLPKPGKGDDADKAARAQEAWKALKKDVKALAALQLLRLELALAGRRRWDPEVFRVFLAGHPLVQHLVRRLVWGGYDEAGSLLCTFRVAEDGSLADAADGPWELPAEVSVGVPHPLDIEPDLLQRWAEVLADYEVLQPFPQLGREVYRIAEEEREARKLRRFEGDEVSTGKVLKLVDQRGWRRGPPGNKGYIWYFEKPLPDRRHLVRLELQPGISVGSPMEEPEQTLGPVIVNRPGSWEDEGTLAFGELDPVTFSELVRDLETLRT